MDRPAQDEPAQDEPGDWRRPGPTPRQRRIDLIIGLTVTAGAMLNAFLSHSSGFTIWDVRRSVAEQLCWAAAVALPLVWRRTHPEVVALTVAAVFIAGQVRSAQEVQFASGAIFAAVYALGAWGRDRPRARILRIIVISSMFAYLAIAWLFAVDTLPPDQEVAPLLSTVVNQVLINTLMFGFAYLFGETAWLAARREQQLREQADELREARAATEERAVIAERVRIARELHDIVAHHVSVMGIQAAAARHALSRTAPPPPAATEAATVALGAVEESARTAVDELHRMLGALRTNDDPTPAAPGIERIEDLVERVRAAGLTVDHAVYGTAVALSASTSQTAYRIVQEAVTNTLKHAHASTVDIRVRYLARELEIDVADDGRGAGPASGGMGLIGMRERTGVLGGTVETGARTSGGFRVRARLPLPTASLPDPSISAPSLPAPTTAGAPR